MSQCLRACVTFAAAAAVFAASAAGAETDARPAKGINQALIEVRPGPHWRPAMPQAMRQAFRCPNMAIDVDFDFVTAPGGRVPDRRRVVALRVDSTPVTAESIARVNDAMLGFAREPRFSPHCTNGAVRIHLYLQEGGRISDSRYVAVSP